MTSISPNKNDVKSDKPRSRHIPTAPAKGWRAWYEMTKPRIVQLMLVTCVGAMALAADGMPNLKVLVVTVFGLGLTISGSGALNHVIDADLDRRMLRTRFRPVAAHVVSPLAGSIYGVLLIVVGSVILYLGTNALTAWLSLIGAVFYVAVYTPLKRVTTHNTVIGGVAGAMPPLVGWAAVTGSVNSVLAWTLFAIMFAWQPAHFWPLSLLTREDYAAAGFKMMSVTHGERATVRATWGWTWLAVATTIVPVVTRDVGVAYAVIAAVANIYLVRRMGRLYRADKKRGKNPTVALVGGADSEGRLAARGAFLGSLTWLALLFAGFAIDAILR